MKKNAIDIIYKAVNSDLAINECINKPELYKGSRGNDLFGYSPDNLSKAALYYSDCSNRLELDKAGDILGQMKATIATEELILMLKKAVFQNVSKIDFLRGKKNAEEIILALYSQFSG